MFLHTGSLNFKVQNVSGKPGIPRIVKTMRGLEKTECLRQLKGLEDLKGRGDSEGLEDLKGRGG